ncbi:hypothetical protein, partial [Klebsiella pneumoniae]|uniref:hypothetical protein n=1 Tax=Klebsiella pneumoniae TaxID=573 RepID=UPI001C6F2002
AEQEGQQTETEATGAPQKHHYTLNQQVGSITVFPDHRVDAKCEAGNDGHYRVSRVKVEMGSQRTPRRCIYFRNPPFPVRNLLV